MRVRTVIAPEMLEPLKPSLQGAFQERRSDEERRASNRGHVKAFRQRNPDRRNEIQRAWRANRRKRLGLPPAKVYQRRKA